MGFFINKRKKTIGEFCSDVINKHEIKTTKTEIKTENIGLLTVLATAILSGVEKKTQVEVRGGVDIAKSKISEIDEEEY